MKAAFEWNDWPVPTPQSFHHWTLARQVDHLVTARESEPDLGFMVRLMALCSLPRTNPRRRKEYKRVNGPFTLYMTAGGGNRLPYGNLPRLLMAWVSTEAVRTRRRELVLGRSLSEFMRKVGIWDDGGAIRRRIRDEYLRQTTVTVVLVGTETKHRKHVDWEVHSSMYDGSVNHRSVILVVNLPSTGCMTFTAAHDGEKRVVYPDVQAWMAVDSRSEYESRYPYVPDRIIDNLVKADVRISVTP